MGKLIPKNCFPFLSAGFLLAGQSANAAAVAFYTDSGFGSMGNANTWGTGNFTNSSVIFEVTLDYTATVAASPDPFTLFENGADGIGSGIAINGPNIIFAAGGGSVANTAAASGSHGLTGGEAGVQILGVLEFDAGTGANELLTLYVNGTQVATADGPTADDWAGANASNLGIGDSFSIFEYVPSLNDTPDDGSNGVFAGDFPDQTTTLDFAAYEFGVGDNTVANILVPEPGSLTLLGLGGVLLLRKRNRS